MAEARRIVPLALLLVAGLVALTILRSGGEDGHTLRAAFTAALQIRPGQHVQVAGRTIGSIRSAKLIDGRAVVELEIDDEHWPLRRGTTASLRYGSPLGYAMRYVELKPGPRSGPPLPEDGLLTQRDTITPVEFDDVPRVFGPRTRRHLSRMLKNAGAVLDESGPDIRRFMEDGAPGTQGVANLTEDLASDPNALRVLIASSAAATGQIARNRGRLGPLLRDATTTMDTLVARSDELGRLLKEAPGTFTEGQRVLAHLNRTSGRLELLSSEFAPGAKGMRRLAPIANRVTDSLATTAPDVAKLLRAASQSAPPLTRFLERGDAVLPTAGKALGGLTEVIGCLRPYAPEIAGYLSTTMGAHASYDAEGRYIRLGLSTYPTTIPSDQTPEEVTKQFPNLHYGMVRAPGQNVGQPWFQPQCGVTPQGLDPAADEEAKR